MKLFIGLLTFVLLSGGAHASTPLYGVNYGNQLTPHNYVASKVDADLIELKAANVGHIRIATQCFDNCAGYLDMTKAVALQAKAKGFSVMWGVDSSASPLTLDILNKMLAASDSLDKWANDNHIDYFNLGNEEDNRVDNQTLIASAFRAKLQDKSAELKAKYPEKIIYVTTQDNISNWSYTGSFDLVGFNLYGGSDWEFRQGISQVQQNPKAIVTEWNLDQGINDVHGSQRRYAQALVNRKNWLGTIPSYVFTLRGGANGIDDRWSLWIGNYRRQAWYAIK